MESGLFTLAMAALAYVAFILAYLFYGRYLSTRIFNFLDEEELPSHAHRDGRDFVPSRRAVLFGHHFTSIAGAGPIVGPAIAVVWGWLPAMLWVIFGAILIGAVHDFSALVISTRNQGRSIVDISREVMNPRVRIIFFLFIYIVLTMVLAVFLYVMAKLFIAFPASVFPIWLQIPIAVGLGVVMRRGGNLIGWGGAALGMILICLWIGQTWVNWDIARILPPENKDILSPYFVWVIILLIYAFVSSVLPVQWLLQPRDYLNSLWLYLGVGGVLLGFVIAPQPLADPTPIRAVEGLPPIFPMLFVVIACGAVSGFHCLVCSGTTSKQLATTQDALPIGYGAMLLEGALAVLVIVACCSGVAPELWTDAESGYGSWVGAKSGAVGAFIQGSASYLSQIGLPLALAKTIMAVILVSFCGTTLDTATRVQRYVIGELGVSLRIPVLNRPMVATSLACVSALALSVFRHPTTGTMGGGGYILWPLFGNINQMLACLALLVTTVYIAKRGGRVIYTLIPCVFLLVTTGYAIFLQTKGFWMGPAPNHFLSAVSLGVIVLELWMLIEGAIVLIGALSLKPAEIEV